MASARIDQSSIAAAYQQSVDVRRQRRDGVVVTPIEVVDFSIRSVFDHLNSIGREIDDGVEWLDPFAGTGIYTARLLQIAPLSPERKRALAANCVCIEIDEAAAQMCFENLARVYRDETGRNGFVRVICADTFYLPSDYDVWADRFGWPGVVNIKNKVKQ